MRLWRIALVLFTWSARLTPHPGMPHYQCYQTLIEVGRLEDAKTVAATLAETYPDDAESHYAYGWVLQSLGRHAEALESFDRALDLNPPAVLAHFARGVSLENLGRLPEAQDAYRLARRHPVTATAATKNFAEVSARHGDWSSSADAYETLFQRDPTFEHGQALAYTLFKANRSSEIPNVIEALRQTATRPAERLELATLLMDIKHERQAISLLGDLHTTHPEDGEVLSALACALAFVGEMDEAGRRVDELRRREPSSALFHATEGIVALRRGEAVLALEAFDRALALTPSDMQVEAFRGFTLHAAGRLEEAFESYQRIERDAPEVLEREEWREDWEDLRKKWPVGPLDS
jgi:Flp pilus assembly protein TadD